MQTLYVSRHFVISYNLSNDLSKKLSLLKISQKYPHFIFGNDIGLLFSNFLVITVVITTVIITACS